MKESKIYPLACLCQQLARCKHTVPRLNATSSRCFSFASFLHTTLHFVLCQLLSRLRTDEKQRKGKGAERSVQGAGGGTDQLGTLGVHVVSHLEACQSSTPCCGSLQNERTESENGVWTDQPVDTHNPAMTPMAQQFDHCRLSGTKPAKRRAPPLHSRFYCLRAASITYKDGDGRVARSMEKTSICASQGRSYDGHAETWVGRQIGAKASAIATSAQAIMAQRIVCVFLDLETFIVTNQRSSTIGKEAHRHRDTTLP